jgi:hypothetical protein
LGKQAFEVKWEKQGAEVEWQSIVKAERRRESTFVVLAQGKTAFADGSGQET